MFLTFLERPYSYLKHELHLFDAYLNWIAGTIKKVQDHYFLRKKSCFLLTGTLKFKGTECKILLYLLYFKLLYRK